MESILKIIIGILGTAARDRLDEKLKNGSTTQEKIRQVMKRELKDIKDTLQSLSRKDLLSSVAFFEEGQSALEDFEESRNERSKTHALNCFDKCLTWSTHAFENDCLSLPDRILAVKMKVSATLMLHEESPALAVKLSLEALERLCSLRAIVKLLNRNTGIGAFLSKKTDEKIKQEVSEILVGIRKFTASNCPDNGESFCSRFPSVLHCQYLSSLRCSTELENVSRFCLDSNGFLITLDLYSSKICRRKIPSLEISNEKDFAHTEVDYRDICALSCFNGDIYVCILCRSGMQIICFDSEMKQKERFLLSPINTMSEISVNEKDNTLMLVQSDGQVSLYCLKDRKFLKCKELHGCRSKGCVNDNEMIFICDSKHDEIVVLDKELNVVRKFGSYGEGPGEFRGPSGITIDRMAGHLLVCDVGNARIQALTRGGHYLAEIKMPQGLQLMKVRVTTGGTVLVGFYGKIAIYE